MTTIQMAKRAARRALPRGAADVARFLAAEAQSPVRFADPGLVAAGFHSEKRWLYPERPGVGAGYVSDLAFSRRVRGLNPLSVKAQFVDKLDFAQRLQAEGLGHRMPRMLGVSRGGRFTATGEPTGEPVVIKPVDGRASLGVAVFDTLDEAVAACPRDRTFVVQQRVRAHAYGLEIFPDSLNGLRVQAFRPAPGAAPRVVVVVQRIGRRATAPGDAFTVGGLLARVTTEGTLTYAVGPVRGRRREWHETHPETGGAIAGRTVPFYDEAKALALEVMALYPEARYIGWDIAISADGPVVMEGNATWPNLAILQAHGPITGDPEVRQFFVRHGLLPA